MSAPSNFARNEAAAPVGGPAGAIEASMASGSGGAGEIGGDGVRQTIVLVAILRVIRGPLHHPLHHHRGPAGPSKSVVLPSLLELIWHAGVGSCPRYTRKMRTPLTWNLTFPGQVTSRSC